MATEDFMFDLDNLITAIEERPVLWDKSQNGYKCRLSTANAWNSICEFINPQFEQMDKTAKSNFVQLVMKKWKNVRDTWLKAQKRLADENRSGSGAFMGKNPIYQDRLSFLKKSTSLNSTESSFTLEKSDEEGTAMPSTSATADDRGSRKMAAPMKRKKNVDSLESEILKTLDSFDEKQKCRDNRHLSFFEGIIPSLNHFDEEDVLEFQAGVINLIQKIRRKKNNPPMIARQSPAITHFPLMAQQETMLPLRHDFQIQDRIPTQPSPAPSSLSDSSNYSQQHFDY